MKAAEVTCFVLLCFKIWKSACELKCQFLVSFQFTKFEDGNKDEGTNRILSLWITHVSPFIVLSIHLKLFQGTD